MMTSKIKHVALCVAFSTVVPLFAASSPASADALEFKPLTLINGWDGGVFGTRQPAVALTSEKIVVFKGAIGNGTTSEPFRLPSKFRPNKVVYVTVDLCDSAKGRLIVESNGAVTIQAQADFADAQCFTSLDGVSFVK